MPLVVQGTSMGGQQSISMAGLHPNVTALLVMVPSGIDVTAPLPPAGVWAGINHSAHQVVDGGIAIRLNRSLRSSRKARSSDELSGTSMIGNGSIGN